jgi:hypothetical protein
MCKSLLVFLTSVTLALLTLLIVYKENKVINLELAIKYNDTLALKNELENSVFSYLPFYEYYQFVEQYLPNTFNEISNSDKYKLFKYATNYDNNEIINLLLDYDVVDYEKSLDYFLDTISHNNKNSVNLMLGNDKFILEKATAPFILNDNTQMLELFINNNRTNSDILNKAVDIALYNNRLDTLKYILKSDKLNLSSIGKEVLKNIKFTEPNLQNKLEIMKLLLSNDQVLKSFNKPELEYYFRLLNKYQC